MERMWVMGKKSCVSKTTVRKEQQCGKNHEGKVQTHAPKQLPAQKSSDAGNGFLKCITRPKFGHSA